MEQEQSKAYVPRAGSVADRVITYLSTVPERWAFADEVADAADTDAATLHGALSTAERFGVVYKDQFQAKTRWHLCKPADAEQGAEASREAATEHLAVKDANQPAADLPIPKFGDPLVKWNGDPKASAAIATDVLTAGTHLARPAPAGPEFACAMFNDGRLLLELDGVPIRLSAAQASTLAGYLARMQA